MNFAQFKDLLVQCRACGGTEFGTGIQENKASVYPNKLIAIRSSRIYYVICTQCGLIQFEFVEKPQVFKSNK